MDFKQTYQQDEFIQFLKNFLPDDFENEQEELTSDYSFRFIGKVTKLGECESLDLKVYEIEHKSENDPRVTLSKEAFRLMRSHASRRSLIIFKNSKTRNYRLSLITFQTSWDEGKKIKTEFSNPRRYSFYLGPDARTKTPEKFLKDKVVDFDDLISRFDVEVVTKEFFAQYKKLYLNLLEQFNNDHAFKAFAYKNSIQLEIFTKKILGQIVFIYFLQRKGWMGAAKGEHISKGDKGFLRTLFEKSEAGGQSYFNEYLEPIFYNCLNKKPEMAASFYREPFECQIPFLNGGLFEPLNNYDWEREFIYIPNELFSNQNKNGILDIFDLYNFTIDENTPDDQEVSVDPEMLGKVFENLIEDNIRKGQGAFYTPREIVHYMCKESLLNYLISSSSISEDSIKSFFDLINQNNETVKASAMFEGEAIEIDRLLKDIKVCDPACGSGAFLIGMLNEIIKLRILMRIFHPNQFEKRSIYQLKKETIQNSLYGVDIDPGAIDIAKLRFWLAIVVDEDIDEIEPLPNLDYKLMQGNSLLEDLVVGDSTISFNFDGNHKFDRRTKDMKNLFEVETQVKLFLDKSETLAEKLEKLHTEYFNIHDTDKKKVLKRKIDSVEDELILSKCQEEIKNTESQIKNSLDQRKNLKKTEKLIEIREVLNKWKKDHLRPFFPWKLHFGEVFGRDQSGFDIVIANPPYIDSESMVKDQKEVRDAIQKSFKFTKGNWDIYIAFFELAFKIANGQGNVTFITPDKWISKPFGDELRLNTLTNLILIVKAGRKIFENAKVDSIITLFSKKTSVNLKILEFDGTNFFLKRKLVKSMIKSPYALDYLFSNYIETLLKLDDKEHRLSDLGTCENACATSDAYKLEPLLTNLDSEYNSDTQLKVTNTGTISKYCCRWGKREMTYLGHKYLHPIVSRVKFKTEFKNSYSKKSVLPKIIAKGLNLLDAFLDEKGEFIPGKSTLIITSDNLSKLKVILAILNSKLTFFYIKEKYPAASYNQGTSFTKDMINNLPISESLLSQEDQLINKIDKILSITSLSDYSDNFAKQQEAVDGYEDQINQIVYTLYDLTPEEIKIVEDSVQ